MSFTAAAAFAAQRKHQDMHSASASPPYPQPDVTTIKPMIDPLLEQANVRLIVEDEKDTDPFAYLKRPIESVPTTKPIPRSAAPDSPFVALPTEIHLLILRHLPWPAQYALKLTSRCFHSIPELPAPVDFFHHRHRGKSFQQSLLISLCAAGIVRRGYEPCYVCRRFRWKTCFEIGQYQRSFLWCDGASAIPGMTEIGAEAVEMGGGWGYMDALDAREGDVFENGKYCIECGVKGGKYKVGERIEVVQEWSDYHSDRQSVVVEAARLGEQQKMRTVKKVLAFCGVKREIEVEEPIPLSPTPAKKDMVEGIDANTEFGFSTASELAQRRLFAFCM